MPVSSIQESFFHAALLGNKHITVELVNGARLSGRVRSFDKYSVILETSTLEQLVFKHSISAAGVCRNRHCLECFPELATTDAAGARGKRLDA
jgi:host factor-I protein